MIVGIDPGITGAIAWMLNGEPHAVQDLPTMQRGKTGNKQQLNGAAFARQIREYKVDHAFVELVKGAPRMKGGASKMGSTSAFNFGHTFGVLEGVLQALGVAYTLIPPEQWKRAAGLVGAEKDVSRTHAIRVFPGLASVFERKKDVGRAEALLIAHYGQRLYDRAVKVATSDPFELRA